MRAGFVLLVIAGAAFTLNAALAYPDGAPWGAANPAQEQHCASCHFGLDPVPDSEALVITALPPRPVPGAIYELAITFDDPDTVVAGFQLIAYALGDDAGTFAATESGIECIGAAARSTSPAKSDGPIKWAVEWEAPDDIESPIVFHVAASAANDDGSPFGDRIHYRTYEVAVK